MDRRHLLGNITYTSDYRIKKDVENLASTWDKVKALRPIRYSQKEFSPPSHDSKEVPEGHSAEPLFVNDDREQWGFIAHELQETLLPTAANGEKDAPDTVQSVNLGAIVSALTRALQEAMPRIEALEAAQ